MDRVMMLIKEMGLNTQKSFKINARVQRASKKIFYRILKHRIVLITNTIHEYTRDHELTILNKVRMW